MFGGCNTKVVRIVLFHSLSETSITRELFQKGDLNPKNDIMRLQKGLDWIGRWSEAQAEEGGRRGMEPELSPQAEQEQSEHQPGLFHQSQKSVLTMVTSLKP